MTTATRPAVRTPGERHEAPPERATGPEGTPLRSAVYRGTVVHRRTGPVDHELSQPVRMVLADLSEIPRLCALHPLWSDRHAAPAHFTRADYLGDPHVPLDQAVRDLVASRTGERPEGPVALLTNIRTWGWNFNPISCYFCFDRQGEEVRWMVAEVTNTPWHQRHAYVVGPPGRHRITKELHVSPFMGMDQEYVLDYTAPGPLLRVRFQVEERGQPVLRAGMVLHRLPATRRTLGQVLWSPRRTAPGVTFGIYRNALTLWRKGAPFHPNPHRSPGRRPLAPDRPPAVDRPPAADR